MVNILMIDDSKAVHSFVGECLKNTAINLFHAYDGNEGVEKVASASEPFDIILLDWEMPVLNGPDTFAKLKELGTNTPVMMLTSKNSPEDITRMLEAGVNDYMMKPFTADILMAKIEDVTGKVLEKGVANVAA